MASASCKLLHFSSKLLHFAAFYWKKVHNLLIILTNFDFIKNFFTRNLYNILIILKFLYFLVWANSRCFFCRKDSTQDGSNFLFSKKNPADRGVSSVSREELHHSAHASHTTHAAHTTTSAHAAFTFFFWKISDHAFCGDHHAGNRCSVL